MRAGRFKGAAEKMIEGLYQAEDDSLVDDIETVTMSVKVSISTASMLNEIASLFGSSRYAFSGEILDDFTADMFFNLRKDDQEKLALSADLVTTEALNKKGVTIEALTPFGEVNEAVYWRLLYGQQHGFEAFQEGSK